MRSSSGTPSPLPTHGPRFHVKHGRRWCTGTPPCPGTSWLGALVVGGFRRGAEDRP